MDVRCWHRIGAHACFGSVAKRNQKCNRPQSESIKVLPASTARASTSTPLDVHGQVRSDSAQARLVRTRRSIQRGGIFATASTATGASAIPRFRFHPVYGTPFLNPAFDMNRSTRFPHPVSSLLWLSAATVLLAVLSAGLAPHVNAAPLTVAYDLGDDQAQSTADEIVFIDTGDQTFDVELGSISSEFIPASTASFLLSPGNLIDFATPSINTPTQVIDDGFTMDVDGSATLSVNTFLEQMNVEITGSGSGFVLTESTSADFSITSFDGFQSVFGQGGMSLVVTARDAGNATIATHI